MSRVLQIARREFVSTVCTKGFIIGIAVMPAILLAVIVLFPLLLNEKAPKVDGSLAVIDRSGLTLPRIEAELTPERIAAREGEVAEKVDEITSQASESLGVDAPPGAAQMIANTQSLPTIRVEGLSADADVEAEKKALLQGSATDGSRLALAVIDSTAVAAGENGAYGSYELFIREKLDDRVERNHLRPALRDAIRDARITAAGYDPEVIDRITAVPRVNSTTVSEKGETRTNEALQMLLPMGFMLLLMIAVMTGGSYLMTTTIEEKSSRVVEVLLAAVSPRQLMTGKIIGQLGVGLLLMGVYSGLGIGALSAFSLLSLLEPLKVVYLIIFFMLAYFMIGSFMAAVGAAVNELREAQSLQTPVMLVVMIPWILWLPISRDPNAPWAVALSMIPPVSPFAMLLRLTSATTEPVPNWQVLLSIGLGIVGVYASIWACAKIFRVGILLHGTPPTFKTLVRWVRMA